MPIRIVQQQLAGAAGRWQIGTEHITMGEVGERDKSGMGMGAD